MLQVWCIHSVYSNRYMQRWFSKAPWHYGDRNMLQEMMLSGLEDMAVLRLFITVAFPLG